MILRTGSPLMAVHVGFCSLKIKRHMRRAQERVTQKSTQLSGETAGPVPKEVYLKEPICRKCPEVR